MEKLKQIFSPGSSKDDQVLYGDAETKRREAAANRTGTTSTSAEPETLQPVEGSSQKEHSILGQITNPGGDKYDEQRFGTTATASNPSQTGYGSSTSAGGNQSDLTRDAGIAGGLGVAGAGGAGALAAHEHNKDSSLGEREDVRRDGGPQTSTTTTATTTTGLQPRSGQTLGEREDVPRTGTISGSSGIESGSQNTSHLARDAAIGTGVGAVGAGGAYAAHERSRDGQSLGEREDVHRSGTVGGSTNRDVGIVGGSSLGGSGAGGNQPEDNTSTSILDRSHPLTGAGDYVNPIGAPQADLTGTTRTGLQSDSGNDSHLGRDAVLAGGLGAGVGAYGASNSHNAPRDGTTTDSVLDRAHPLHGSGTGVHDPFHGTGSDSNNPAALSQHASQLGTHAGHSSSQGDDLQSREAGAQSGFGRPHTTIAGAMLDPHVPGEFPTATGEDPHAGLNTSDRSRDQGLTGAGASALNSRDNNQQATGISSTTTGANTSSLSGAGTQSTGDDHHYGRDAAVAGGLGAAGAGAFAAHESSQREGKSLGDREDVPRHDPTSSTTTHHPTTSTTTTTSQTQPTTAAEKSHTGRDAALAGGAGAVGVGAYEASKHHDDNTLGERNDVRRQDPTTISQTQPTTAAEKSHTGRDAALAGGAGAVGVGAYEASKHHDDNTLGERRQDPRTISQTQPTTAAEKSHTGRDAALAGGAGAVGVGAYEASKHHDDKTLGERRQDPTSTTTGSTTTGYGPGQSNPSGVIKAPGTNSSAAAEDLQHQHGRDQAVAAPIGSGAYTASSDSRLSSDPAHLAAQRAAEKDTSHTGRDTAIGAGAGGAAAIGAEKAYENDKHSRNKLHKPSPEEKKHEKEVEHEKKPGLLNRILHPGRHANEEKEHKSHDDDRDRQHGTGATTATGATAASGSTVAGTGHAFGTTESGARGHPLGTAIEPKGDERPIEPHTGLPMNTAKYGSGAGGTDGSPNIEGYHGTTGGSTNQTSLPDRSQQTQYGDAPDLSSTGTSNATQSSHLGRDTGIAGGLAGAGGAGAYAAHEHNKQHDGGVSQTSSSQTDGLADRSGATQTGSTGDSQHGVQRSERQTHIPIAPGASTTASSDPTDRYDDQGVAGPDWDAKKSTY